MKMADEELNAREELTDLNELFVQLNMLEERQLHAQLTHLP